MNRIIIVVTDYLHDALQCAILLGSNEEVKIALNDYIEILKNGNQRCWNDTRYKILLDKRIQNISSVKDKISCINFQKQVLIFGNKFLGTKLSFAMTNPNNYNSATYWFGYEGAGLGEILCKHKVINVKCDCHNKLLDKVKKNKNLRFLDLAIPSIMKFILELNL